MEVISNTPCQVVQMKYLPWNAGFIDRFSCPAWLPLSWFVFLPPERIAIDTSRWANFLFPALCHCVHLHSFNASFIRASRKRPCPAIVSFHSSLHFEVNNSGDEELSIPFWCGWRLNRLGQFVWIVGGCCPHSGVQLRGRAGDLDYRERNPEQQTIMVAAR